MLEEGSVKGRPSGGKTIPIPAMPNVCKILRRNEFISSPSVSSLASSIISCVFAAGEGNALSLPEELLLKAGGVASG